MYQVKLTQFLKRRERDDKDGRESFDEWTVLRNMKGERKKKAKERRETLNKQQMPKIF